MSSTELLERVVRMRRRTRLWPEEADAYIHVGTVSMAHVSPSNPPSRARLAADAGRPVVCTRSFASHHPLPPWIEVLTARAGQRGLLLPFPLFASARTRLGSSALGRPPLDSGLPGAGPAAVFLNNNGNNNGLARIRARRQGLPPDERQQPPPGPPMSALALSAHLEALPGAQGEGGGALRQFLIADAGLDAVFCTVDAGLFFFFPWLYAAKENVSRRGCLRADHANVLEICLSF